MKYIYFKKEIGSEPKFPSPPPCPNNLNDSVSWLQNVVHIMHTCKFKLVRSLILKCNNLTLLQAGGGGFTLTPPPFF